MKEYFSVLHLSHKVAERRGMRCHLYDAAGNRILWLDSRSDVFGSYDQFKLLGYELARQFRSGQDLTAVLFGNAESQHALFWNADGSYEMVCGNAIRCLAHFLCDDSLAQGSVAVATQHGNYLSRKLDRDHGAAVIPSSTIRVGAAGEHGDLIVDVGTPHRIRLVDREWPSEDVAAAMAHSNAEHPVNFSLVRRVAPYRYRVRIFERGAGETSSCGTAAIAIAAAVEMRAASSTAAQSPQHIEFASGERLSVTHNPSRETFEIRGRVTLLRDLSN
jgi:diaminopimelate epimerase